MKIAVITPGVLPIPSVKGGAVETLIDFYIEHNESCKEHKITVYSIFDDALSNYDFKHFSNTEFYFHHSHSLSTKVQRKLYQYFHKNFYYNHFIEYFLADVIKQIKKKQFDLIIVENRQGFIPILSKEINSPIILHLHNDTLDKDQPYAKDILQACTKVIAISKYIKKKVDTIQETNKVEIVYNGIDLNRFNIKNVLKLSRKEFGLSDNDFVVVYTGRIEKIKGIYQLIESFQLLQEYKDIKLLIVGGNINSQNKQIISCGNKSYHQIPSILSLCDLAVIPSICEDALTMTALEDMAMGIPLIVTRSGGIPEAVDEECALIIDKENSLPKKLAKAILSLYNNEEQRKQMSLHGKQRASLFSKDKYAQTFMQKLSFKK